MNKLTALEKEIKKYTNSRYVRLHVPGHKGRGGFDFADSSYDITELDFSDNLNHPNAVLLQSEQALAEVFGAKFTKISVNGASACVMAAIMSAVRPGQTLLIPSDSHISAYYAAVHANAKVFRVNVADIVSGITLNELSAAVKDVKKSSDTIAACVITSPTYFGSCTEIEKITEYLSKEGITAIIDEAHGAHFPFSPLFPNSAVGLAPYVIHSAHKTIGALTQTALIHTECKADYLRSGEKLRMLQSTSPSYLLILSVLSAVNEFSKEKKLFDEAISWYNKFNEEFSSSCAVRLVNNCENGRIADPMKAFVSFPEKFDIKRLKKEFRLVSEMEIGNSVLFSFGSGSTSEDFITLYSALTSVAKEYAGAPTRNFVMSCPGISCSYLIDIAHALNCENEEVDIYSAQGRICDDFIMCYPPGTPMLIPGQKIDAYAVRMLEENKMNLIGIRNNKIKVLKQ